MTTIKADAFIVNVQIAATDHALDKQMSKLRADFQAMEAPDKEQVLEFLFASKFPSTYAQLKSLAPNQHNFDRDSFRKGVRNVKDDGRPMNDLELSNTRDAFSRLESSDQQAHTLAFLASVKMPLTYEAVKSIADDQVRKTAEAYVAAGVDKEE